MVRVIIIVTVLMSLLTSCVFAPGMKMRSVPFSTQFPSTYHAEPHFIPINVQLVRQFQQWGMDTQDDAYYYHISPHDVLNIHVWGHPELAAPVGLAATESNNSNLTSTISTGGYLVDPSGDIYYPLIGTVHLGGKTVQQARITLSSLLKKYIRNPQMDVRVTGFRSKKVYVMGEVMKPGLFPLTDAPLSLTDVINLAGGMDPNVADPSHIFVIRGDYACPDVYWLDAGSPDALLLGEGFRLKNHDVVFVSTAPVARWNRAINQILPSVQTVWFTYSIIKNK